MGINVAQAQEKAGHFQLIVNFLAEKAPGSEALNSAALTVSALMKDEPEEPDANAFELVSDALIELNAPDKLLSIMDLPSDAASSSIKSDEWSDAG
jgi:hypothetical protein